MNIKELEQLQIERLLKHSDGEEEHIYPQDVKPASIKDYPLAIAAAEKFMRLCRARTNTLKEDLQFTEDSFLSAIEDETILFETAKNGKPAVYRKRYSSEAKRQRELRTRLYLDNEYQSKKEQYDHWNERRADWMTYINKLKREYELLQTDYHTNGGVI